MANRSLAASLLIALAALAVPAAASAGSVSLSTAGCSAHECDPTLAFEALPGERNDVTMAEGGGFTALVTDAGAPLEPGHGCAAVDEHTVACTPQDYEYLYAASAKLGDEDDRLEVRDYRVSAHGGDGDDTILGTGTLEGGRGHDVLDSAEGSSTAVFRGRDVRVDLESSKPQGGRGSKEVLRGIRDVNALHAEGAVVRGNDHSNRIEVGKDGIAEGRGGADFLRALPGGRVDGGGGNDDIQGNDFGSGPLHSSTAVACGPGEDDDVFNVALNEIVSADCEEIEPGVDDDWRELVATPRDGAPFVTHALECGGGEPECPFLLEARVGSTKGRLVAHRRVVLRTKNGHTASRRVGLKLSADGRELLHRRGRLRVVVYARDAYGDPSDYGPPEGFTAILLG